MRGLGRRRRGVGAAAPPAREPIRGRGRLLTGRGAPAPHHRFPEQLIHAHWLRTGITTAATARITMAVAMVTITDRPSHGAGRFILRSHTAVAL